MEYDIDTKSAKSRRELAEAYVPLQRIIKIESKKAIDNGRKISLYRLVSEIFGISTSESENICTFLGFTNWVSPVDCGSLKILSTPTKLVTNHIQSPNPTLNLATKLATNFYCPDECEHLKPMESQQNAQKSSRIHLCRFYPDYTHRVFHGTDLNHHPKLIRHKGCPLKVA